MKSAVLASLVALAVSPIAACASAGGQYSMHTYTSDANGFDTNSYWMDTGAEVVVFDAQFTPAIASALLADIRAITASPVRWVVVTHPNPDKFNGAPVFQAVGAKVVASAATARAMPGVHAYKKAYFTSVGMFDEATYPTLPAVDVTFDGSFDLPLEAGSVQLVELAHGGVTSTQTVAITEHGAVVGDLFANRAHAWLEGAVDSGRATPGLPSWHGALDETLGLVGADTTILPGRGEPLKAAVAVAEQHVYLTRAEAVVRAELGTMTDPTATLAGPDAGSHYQAIQDALHAAFPTYRFDYLIGYGVYGLAAQLAAE